jgi:hypothetical protein
MEVGVTLAFMVGVSNFWLECSALMLLPIISLSRSYADTYWSRHPHRIGQLPMSPGQREMATWGAYNALAHGLSHTHLLTLAFAVCTLLTILILRRSVLACRLCHCYGGQYRHQQYVSLPI